MATQILFNGKVNGLVSSTRMFAIQGYTNWVTSSAQVAVLVPPHNGTIKNFRVKLSDAPGSGNTRTFTIFDGLTDTGINVTFGATDSGTKEDLTNTYAFDNDSHLYIEGTSTGTPNITSMQHSLMMEGDVSGETALMGRTGVQLGVDTAYISFAGHSPAGGEITEPVTEIVIPTPGTLKVFTVFLQIQPGGATKQRFFTIRKNGADTSLAVTLTNTDFKETDSGSITVAKGDLINVKHTTANSPAASNASVAVIFVPDTVGEFIIPTARGATFDTSSVRYHSPTAHDRLVGSTVAGIEQLSGDAFEIRNIAVDLDTAPGSGNRYIFTFRENGIDQGTQMVIEDAATAGQHDINADVAAAALCATRVLPRFGPAASQGTICYTGFIAEPAPPSDVSAMMMGANF